MKKQIVITLLTTTLLFAAGIAQAKSTHGGHHNSGHRNSGHHSNGHQGNRHNGNRHNGNRHNGNRHNGNGHHSYGHRSYGHHSYGYSGYGNHGYGHHGYGRHSYGHYRYNNGLGYVAGALALGSLVYAIDRNQNRETAYLARPAASTHEYWYRVDADGRCVQIKLNQYGQEVWTTVDSSYCY